MNTIKKILFITSCVLTILFPSGHYNCVFAAAEADDIAVYIDGTEADFPDVKPYISDNRTLVPVRFISEQLGASVNWNSESGTIVIVKDDENVKLIIGSKEVIKNGVAGSMDVAPVIKEGRTMVPLRFVSEQLGATVEWDAVNNYALIATKKSVTTYTVKAGDTLWRIAMTFGVNIEELSKINPGLNPDKLMVDQQINLPLASAQAANSSSAAKETQSQENSINAQTPEASRGGGREISLNCSADEFVEYAKEFIGVPYAYGGATPEGFDCSGFTHYVSAHFGGYLPHSSGEQYNYGINVEKTDLKPGDLVFFEASNGSGTIGHVGIYVGEGKFIHAPQANGSVEISNLSNVYFDRNYYGAKRIDMLMLNNEK